MEETNIDEQEFEKKNEKTFINYQNKQRKRFSSLNNVKKIIEEDKNKKHKYNLLSYDSTQKLPKEGMENFPYKPILFQLQQRNVNNKKNNMKLKEINDQNNLILNQ